MEVKVLIDEKNKLLIEMDNQTVAEVLRVYANKDEDVKLVAWKREHPDKPVRFEIQTKGKSARKIFEEAVEQVEKDTNKYVEEFKKALK